MGKKNPRRCGNFSKEHPNWDELPNWVTRSWRLTPISYRVPIYMEFYNLLPKHFICVYSIAVWPHSGWTLLWYLPCCFTLSWRHTCVKAEQVIQHDMCLCLTRNWHESNCLNGKKHKHCGRVLKCFRPIVAILRLSFLLFTLEARHFLNIYHLYPTPQQICCDYYLDLRQTEIHLIQNPLLCFSDLCSFTIVPCIII